MLWQAFIKLSGERYRPFKESTRAVHEQLLASLPLARQKCMPGHGLIAGDAAMAEADAEVAGRAKRAEVEALLACLPGLDSREGCDELAVNFCYVNSKGARKRMVRAHRFLCVTPPFGEVLLECGGAGL